MIKVSKKMLTDFLDCMKEIKEYEKLGYTPSELSEKIWLLNCLKEARKKELLRDIEDNSEAELEAYKNTGFSAEDIEDLKAILDVEGDGQSGKDTLNQLLELARYKNLEKEGRLIELPCGIGDTVYENVHGNKTPFPNYVKGFSTGELSTDDEMEYEDGEIYIYTYSFGCSTVCPISEIGKTIFLTQEEAEKAIAEMEGK